MSEPKQPDTWTVKIREDDPTRARLVLNCDQACNVPLSVGEPRISISGPRRWGWNGNVESPSVTPSINCSRCGWHKTITKGVAA